MNKHGIASGRSQLITLAMLLSCVCSTGWGQYTFHGGAVRAVGGTSSGGNFMLYGGIGADSAPMATPIPEHPTPSPMEWATAPHATSSTSITMTAVQASDPDGGIMYWFEETTGNPGATSSTAWQTDRTFTDDGLDSNTTYRYRVRAKDALNYMTEWSMTLPARTHQAPGDIPEGSAEPVSGEMGSDLALSVDPFTGSAKYSIPIAVPPGRQGSEPKIALNYGGGNGWCGVGWSLGIGAISRDTRRGVPVARDAGTGEYLNYYDDDKGFTVAFGAVSSRLVLISEDAGIYEYRAETDQAFLKYEYDPVNNTWEVTDKSGNKFFFGEVAGETNPPEDDIAGAVMVHPHFNGTHPGDKTFTWALANIQDINGNRTYAYYYKDDNQDPHTTDAYQIYLEEVTYNGHVAGLSTSASIKFQLEADPPGSTALLNRPDRSFSYITGYRVETNRRLLDIRVEQNGNLVRRYRLNYEQSPSTLKSLLKSVAIYGTDGDQAEATPLPPVTFDYTEKPSLLEDPIDWGPLDDPPEGEVRYNWGSPRANTKFGPETVSKSGFGTDVELVDINGDSLPDRIMRKTTDPHEVFYVQFNNGAGFDSVTEWSPIDTLDGVPAGEQLPREGWGFPSAYYNLEATMTMSNRPQAMITGWADMDGDGDLDRIMHRRTEPKTPTTPSDYYSSTAGWNFLHIQKNNLLGFDSTTTWGPVDLQGFEGEYVFEETNWGDWHPWYLPWRVPVSEGFLWCSLARRTGEILVDSMYINPALLDINADGLPDRIMVFHSEDTEGGAWNSEMGRNKFRVQLNTGNGFERSDPNPTSPGGPDAITIDWGPVNNRGFYPNLWYNSFSVIRQDWADGGEGTNTTMVDLNGDGLPDRVTNEIHHEGPGIPDVYDVFLVQFNTGYGFQRASFGQGGGTDHITYEWPVHSQGNQYYAWNCITTINGSKTDGCLIDINGDGLPDRVQREIQTNSSSSGDPALYDVYKVELNTGTGFIHQIDNQDIEWPGVSQEGPDGSIFYSVSGFDEQVTMLDINGDGLLDRVMREPEKDTTGDPDKYDYFRVQLNPGPLPDKLLKVTSGLGGSAEITYDRSNSPDNHDQHQDNGGRNRLPMPIYVVGSLTTRDGMGNEASTTYQYSRGYWDSARREFGGFGRVVITDPHGTSTVRYFHQGGGYDDPTKGEFEDTIGDVGQFAKRGLAYRTELWGNEEPLKLLYNVTINMVEAPEVLAGKGWYFPHISQTISLDYEGANNDTGAYRAKAVSTAYDTGTGNVIRQSLWGEVTNVNMQDHTYTNPHTTDDLHTHTTYQSFTNNTDIINKPARILVTDKVDAADEEAEKLKETWLYYDEEYPNQVLYTGTRGNLTAQSVWLDKTEENGQIVNNLYLTSYTYYDLYGNPKAKVNPIDVDTDRTTVMEYDSTYQIFTEKVITGRGALNASFDFADETGKFVTQTTRDPLSGVITESVDVMDIETSYYYDAFFRLTDIYQSTAPGADPTLHLTEITYPTVYGIDNGTTSLNVVHQRHTGYEAYTYNDGLGRIIQTRIKAEDSAGADMYRASHVQYDATGRIVFSSLPYFNTGSGHSVDTAALGTSTEYDPIGRPWRVTPPAGDTGSPTGPSTTAYKASDGTLWATMATDAEGNVKTQYFDGHGRVIQLKEKVTDPVNPTTEVFTDYGYDRLGRMTEIMDHASNTITQTFDSLGRRVSVNDPDLGYWHYVYDRAGNLVKQTDARNNLTKMVYDEDEINRLTAKEVYNSSGQLAYTATYTYDASSDSVEYPMHKGLLHQVTDKEGTVTHGYDNRGRLLKTTRSLTIENGNAYTTQMAYDWADRLSVLTYPNLAAQIGYTYDKVGHLAEVVAHTGTGTPNEMLYQSTTYNALDQIEGVDYGNGVKTRYAYYTNSKRRQRILTDMDGDPANPNPTNDYQNLSYTYDMVANITGIVDGSPFAGAGEADSSFTGIQYDGLNRLRSLNYAVQGYTEFQYDALGNITHNGENGGSAMTYHTTKVHAVVNAYGNTYQYDAAGNMTHRNSAVQNMFYDEENQLIRYGTDPATDITFGYSVGGQRLWKKKGSMITGLWIGDLWEYKDEDGDGIGQTLCHVKAGGELICSFEPDPQPDDVFYYYQSDHLGSASVLTDRNGNICQHYGYRAFGEQRWDDPAYNANLDVSNRYTGQILDKDTGLYYYGARYYAPELGRFIQPDPVIPDAVTANSQALNRYAYCYNNPLVFNDPSGNDPEEVQIDQVYSGTFSNPVSITQAWIYTNPNYTTPSFVNGMGVMGGEPEGAIYHGGSHSSNNLLATPTYDGMLELNVEIIEGYNDGYDVYNGYLESSDDSSGFFRNTFDTLNQANSESLAGLKYYANNAYRRYRATSIGKFFNDPEPISQFNYYSAISSIALNDGNPNAGLTTGDLNFQGTIMAVSVVQVGMSAYGAADDVVNSTTHVGRWMSEKEYKLMLKSGKVQMSQGNMTHVTIPANPAAFKAAKPGSIFVEFDVPLNSVVPGGKQGWGIIPGEGSIYDKLSIQKGLKGFSMPPATNIIKR